MNFPESKGVYRPNCFNGIYMGINRHDLGKVYYDNGQEDIVKKYLAFAFFYIIFE